MKNLILLVEDETQLGQTLKDFFENNDLSVVWAKDGDTAIQLFKETLPQLVLLDIILPFKNGFEVAAEIQKLNNLIPIIFMTGTALEMNDYAAAYQVYAAKNYLEKPISPYAALAQIKSLLQPKSTKIYHLHDTFIKIENQLLTINNVEFQLREKEIQVFSFLLDNLNVTISRKDILNKVWSNDFNQLNNMLDTSVSRIKKILRVFPFIKIRTIYGYGYKLTLKT